MRKMAVLTIFVILAALLAGCAGGDEIPATGDIVTFPDPNLEAAIREVIGESEGDIYQSDLEGLTELDTANKSITNLNGLEHCTSLTKLGLNDNQISDLSPLQNLTSLTQLWLDNNQISDIEPLVNNPGLSGRDTTYLADNPLSIESTNVYIPQLEARGIEVVL
jgi:Leucine-rich repeat (LRR) protein